MDKFSFLKDFGWNGKFPIPVSYFGGCTLQQLSTANVNIIASDADNKCFWCADEESALRLVEAGHLLLSLDEVRIQFLRNKELRDEFPHWEGN